jgi:TonB family protein
MVPKITRTHNGLFGRDPAKTVMKLSVVISLACHLGIVLAVQKALPLHWTIESSHAYRVELIRPPVDPSETKEGGEANLAKVAPLTRTPPEETEDTISLDTSDKRYSSYARDIKARLMNHWKYPREARKNLLEGKLLLLFTLNPKGALMDLRILEPSSSRILDREAMRAVRAAAPFPAFPSSVSVGRLHVKAKFDYRLTAQAGPG